MDLSLFQTRVFEKLTTRLPGGRKLGEWSYDKAFQSGSIVGFCGVYDTLEAARAAIPSLSPSGYDNQHAAAMYRDRLNRVYPADYPVMFWLKEVLPQTRRVFDLGGHVGIARYAYRRYLEFPADLLWQVCDVPAVVEQGRELAAESKLANLEFTTEFEQANGAEVFFSAGALQYLDWSFPARLGRLSAPPRHVLLNLLPVTEERSYYTVQNIVTAFCPYRILNRPEFIGAMEEAGYVVRDAWENPEKSCLIPFHPERSLSSYQGFYFERA